MTGDFVIDASVAVAWIQPSQATQLTQLWLQNVMAGATIHAPSLWPIEIANVLIVLQRRGRLTQKEREKAMALLRKLAIRIDSEAPLRAFDEVSNLAIRHRLSAYDAASLELASRLRLPLASKDEALRAAAVKHGIQVH